MSVLRDLSVRSATTNPATATVAAAIVIFRLFPLAVFAWACMATAANAAERLASQSAPATRPNILWLTSEDHGPNLGCYGDPVARTPNVDALAARGMRYDRVWSTAPVCAPARTALISGIYPASLGALHMRSMVAMPENARMYPQYLQDAGYYCVNNSKTDYNLREPGKVWNQSSNRAHWRNRRADQPFFAIFNSTKSHESQIRTRPHKAVTDPNAVRVPSYHPDTRETRQDWAQYYDQVAAADADAGQRLRELEDAGLADQTIIFYFADHGSGMPRHKRWPGNSGLRVPLVVYFPPAWRHLAPSDYAVGGSSRRLVGFVDFAPTVLSLAGIKPPASMQGRAFAGPFATDPPEFLFGQRGRMDERLDLVRSATDGRFVYLRNFHPELSHAQRVAYQFETPTTRVWHELFQQGKTTPAQSLFWSAPKPVEELYDLQTDPDEVVNVAGRPEHQATVARFRAALRRHLLATRDLGFLPESEQFARAGALSPADYARGDAAYPLERILAVAEFASALSADPEKSLVEARKLLESFGDGDSAVRYWAALGVRIRGRESVTAAAERFRAALDDPSPAVRIEAAQALAEHGESVDRMAALERLAGLAVARDHGVLVAMAALSAIEALGVKAEPLRARLATLEANGPSPDSRYNSYVPRLLRNLGNSAVEE
ncbi:MAG: hypothetical protein RLY70_4573 [Planctomycetota bacterium]